MTLPNLIWPCLFYWILWGFILGFSLDQDPGSGFVQRISGSRIRIRIIIQPDPHHWLKQVLQDFGRNWLIFTEISWNLCSESRENRWFFIRNFTKFIISSYKFRLSQNFRNAVLQCILTLHVLIWKKCNGEYSVSRTLWKFKHFFNKYLHRF